MDDNLKNRAVKEISMMEKVFESLVIKDSKDSVSSEFFNMSSNYFNDGKFFMEKKDYLRAFEAVVISWSYIDAGLKAGFFNVPEDLRHYFTL